MSDGFKLLLVALDNGYTSAIEHVDAKLAVLLLGDPLQLLRRFSPPVAPLAAPGSGSHCS